VPNKRGATMIEMKSPTLLKAGQGSRGTIGDKSVQQLGQAKKSTDRNRREPRAPLVPHRGRGRTSNRREAHRLERGFR